MISDALKTMERSPLFSVSLGSKELFHSDFIWWLCRKYPNEMGNLFSEYLSDRSGSTKINIRAREEGNIDLRLEFDNGQKLLIENKVKSIPYPEQLDRYAKENPKISNRLLLAFFDVQDKPTSVWQFLSYSKLSEKLHQVTEAVTDNYHKMLIRDYREIIAALATVADTTGIDFVSDNYDFFDDSKDLTLRALRDLRFHDWYLKRKAELMAMELFTRMKARMPQERVVRTSDVWKESPYTFGVGSGMTRGQGLTDVWYLTKDEIVFGVQVQSDRYKLMVITRVGGKCQLVGERLRSWFEPPNLEIQPPPKGELWNRYGQTIVYRFARLSPSLKVGAVIDLMIDGIQRAKKAATLLAARE